MPVYDQEKTEDLNALTGVSKAEEKAIDARANDSPGSLRPDQINQSERNPNVPNSPEASQAEKNLYNQSGDSVANQLADSTPAGKALSVVKRIVGKPTKKKAGVGGLLGGVIILVVIISNLVSTLALQHIRNNALEIGNLLPNQALRSRRNKTFSRFTRELASGTRTNIDMQKFQNEFRSKGFVVELDTDNKLSRLGYPDPDAPGGLRSLDLGLDSNSGNYKTAASNFFSDDAFGRNLSSLADEATGGNVKTFRNPSARRLLTSRLKISGLTDWLSNRRVVAAGEVDANARNMAYALNEAADVDRATSIRARGAAYSDGIDPDTGQDNITYGDEFDEKIASVNEAIANNESPNGALGINNGVDGIVGSDEVAQRFRSGIEITSLDLQDLAQKVTGASPEIGARIAGKAARAIDITEYTRTACRVKGLIAFAGYLKSVSVATQTATFAVRFMTAADHQKAGLITSDGLAVLMNYLTTPNPITGHNWSNSGGLNNIVFGNASARPSQLSLSQYGTSRAPVGLFGAIYTFLNRVPATNQQGCKIVNNGAVQLGGIVVGIAAAILSGGGVTAAQIAAGIGFGLIEEVAFIIGEPLVVRAATNSVVSGFEYGDGGGDAFASGFGSFRGMNANINGLRPITTGNASTLRAQANIEYSEKIAQQSFYENYLNIYNHRSLASSVMFKSFGNMNTNYLRNSSVSYLSNIFTSSPLSLFSTAINLTSPSATAQTEDESCFLEDVEDLNIETDVFCNVEFASAPDIDLDAVEDILKNHTVAVEYGSPDTIGCSIGRAPHPLIDDGGYPISYNQAGQQGGINSSKTSVSAVHAPWVPKTQVSVEGRLVEDCDVELSEKRYFNDDLADYQDYCHSGRPGVLYATATAAGTGDELVEANIEAHETSRGMVTFENLLNPCTTTKDDGQTACPALANDTDQNCRYELYSAWIGWLADSEAYEQDINGEQPLGQNTVNNQNTDFGSLECPDDPQTININGTTYFQLPDAANGEYVITGGTPAAQRYGLRELICVLYTTAKNYKNIYGADSTLEIGDLNASGHASHNGGIAVDLDAQGNIVAGDWINGGNRYSPEATIDLGKMLVSTGLIKNIWWCGQGSVHRGTTSDDGTLEAIRAFAESQGTPVNIKCLAPNGIRGRGTHANHFHVDINLEKGAFHEP